MTNSNKDWPRERRARDHADTGMLGDRAAVTFSSPEEIAKFIESKC
jgi:hypothetical protein